MSRVGNFFGKLFSGQPADEGKDLPLRAYGKLPMYAEYRRLQVAPGTPTVYSQWMDAGRLAWVQAAAQRGEKGSMVSTRLLGKLPAQKELVVASMWDSRDNVGRIGRRSVSALGFGGFSFRKIRPRVCRTQRSSSRRGFLSSLSRTNHSRPAR